MCLGDNYWICLCWVGALFLGFGCLSGFSKSLCVACFPGLLNVAITGKACWYEKLGYWDGLGKEGWRKRSLQHPTTQNRSKIRETHASVYMLCICF